MDKDFQTVFHFLSTNTKTSTRLAVALRNAIDFALNGARTGRYSVNKLNKTEKTLIGTFFEAEFRRQFDFPDGVKSDVAIEGVDVQIKFSLFENRWMISPENIDEVCILATADEDESKFSVGIMRISRAHLTDGENRDKKKQLAAKSRSEIQWLVMVVHLRKNLSNLDLLAKGLS